MKIAVVHEWLIDWGGSEQVVEQILQCYPSADLFALVDFLPQQLRAKVLNKRARTSFLQRMPFARSKLEWYLPWMPIAIEQLDLSGYDLVISSSHAVAKGVLTGPDQVHVSYVHSPMRYAWDLQPDYLRGGHGKGLTGLALRAVLHYLRMWDVRTAHGVDAIAANSQFIARRIAKAYGKSAQVIHPPVDVRRFTVANGPREPFYVCISRLMPYKRVDLIIDAFRELTDRRLRIIGTGPELRRLAKTAPGNVELLGHQPDEVVRETLQRAQALVFAAKEDFGIIAVESQACGTPVIGYGVGGLAETVNSLGSRDPTGVLFDEQTPAALVSAVRTFERNREALHALNCRRNAERFSQEAFRASFHAFVEEHLGRRNGRIEASPARLAR